MHVSIRTPQGTVRGHARGDHSAFLGIPYAQAPVGPLRFAAPLPAPTWPTSTRDALAFGAVSPQTDRGSVTARGVQSEDCLYLNVFTPAPNNKDSKDNQRRPVMVWIHGGAFSWGAGSEPTYDGGALAARGDVVVVTINYRLGVFGYLYLEKHGGADWGATSNAGQLDQVAALAWVRDNIAAYGGDPEQVTIFGESAGAVAVCALLTTPSARGLFVRAISQSGTANRLPSPAVAGAATERFTSHLGLPAANATSLGTALRALDVPALLRAHAQVYIVGDAMFWPVVDGHVIPERSLSAIRAGWARDIPLLIGSNRDEMKFYIPAKRPPLDSAALLAGVSRWLPAEHKARAAEVCETFRASRSQRGHGHANTDIIDAFETSLRFNVQAARLAAAQAEQQQHVYHYLFDWESPIERLGACHALELPFVFGTLAAPGNDRFAGAGADAERLSQQMMDSWIAFAKTGDPSCESVGEWPRYDAAQRQTQVFGKRTHVQAAPFEEERALIEQLLP
jgi:para-nitrobenzyl esterase